MNIFYINKNYMNNNYFLDGEERPLWSFYSPKRTWGNEFV